MTTSNDSPRSQRGDDDRPPVVRQAEAGAAAWRAAARIRQGARPDHADFYAVAGNVVDTLRALDDLVAVLARQTAGYGSGRKVYDDECANPAHRLRCAVLALAETRHGISLAERAANQFWSAIGHIGVRYDEDGVRP